MKFAEYYLAITRRVAAINVAHLVPNLRDDGLLEIELLVASDGQVAPVAFVSEDSPEAEFSAFDAQIDALEAALEALEKEDEQTEAQIREVLLKLTPDERRLIERPLPEDLPDEDEGEEHY